MIEDLTPERLREIGFNDETIKRLETWEDYNVNLIGDEIFYASGNEKKIYSGIHAGRKIYFRDEERPTFPEGCLSLYPEYYKLVRLKYLKTRKEIGQSLYQEASGIKAFHLNQVETMKKVIEDLKAEKREADLLLITNSLSNKIVRYDIVLEFLENIPAEDIVPATDIQFGATVNEIKLVDLSPSESIKTRKTIDKHFEFIKDKCFEYQEYETFATMLTDFFEYKNVIYPEVLIKSKPSSIGNIARVMQPLWRELKEGDLKHDTEYFKIIKTISVFSKKPFEEIYRDVTRHS